MRWLTLETHRPLPRERAGNRNEVFTKKNTKPMLERIKDELMREGPAIVVALAAYWLLCILYEAACLP